VLAEVDHAFPACVAAAAGGGVLLDDHPIADPQIADPGSCLSDIAGVLMAEHDRGVGA
jgi:hypothetical protein